MISIGYGRTGRMDERPDWMDGCGWMTMVIAYVLVCGVTLFDMAINKFDSRLQRDLLLMLEDAQYNAMGDTVGGCDVM